MATHVVKMTPGQAGIASLKRRVLSARALLVQIGAMLVYDSQSAFTLQRFGDVQWPATYPKQKPPTLNLAWTLKDFAAGKAEPNARRFNNRPAGIATGEEPQQINWQLVGDNAVEIGTVMEGADAMQTGGKLGTIPVTDDAKKRMEAWLSDGSAPGRPGPNEVYRAKLRRFLAPNVTDYKLIGYARPFIGIIPERANDFGELIAEHIASEPA